MSSEEALFAHYDNASDDVKAQLNGLEHSDVTKLVNASKTYHRNKAGTVVSTELEKEWKLMQEFLASD